MSILPSLAAVITLASNIKQSAVKINRGDALTLRGVVRFSSLLSSNVSWGLDYSTSNMVDLSSVSLTPVTQSFPTNDANVDASSSMLTKTVYLALPSNVLPAGLTYTFYLTCSLSAPGSSISIEVNKAPSPGSFSISHSAGEELSTSFMMSCSRWVDDDMPLTYAFGYVSAS